MAASAWIFYNSFKKFMGDSTIDLGGDTFRLGLYNTSSNAQTVTLSTRASLTNEISVQFGYVVGGNTITGVTWTVGASASEYRFDATSVIFSASGGSISAVRFAVVYDESTGTSAGNRKVCMSASLSTAQFAVSAGNTLTITPSSNGIFELN